MFPLPPPPLVILSAPVTVIAGVLLDGDHILLLADRAVHDPRHRHYDGSPYTYGDVTKVLRTDSGVAIAVAGLLSTDGRGDAGPLLAAVRAQASGAAWAETAATAVQNLFTDVADDVRAHAAAGNQQDSAEEPPIESAHTVALVAGPGPRGPRLFVVALTAAGDCMKWQVRQRGQAFAPTLADTAVMDAAIGAAAGGAMPAAVRGLGDALGEVAVAHPATVTRDFDYAVVSPTGAGLVQSVRVPRLAPPPGV